MGWPRGRHGVKTGQATIAQYLVDKHAVVEPAHLHRSINQCPSPMTQLLHIVSVFFAVWVYDYNVAAGYMLSGRRMT